MDSATILDRLERNKPVRVADPVPGLGEAYFSRLVVLYGGDVRELEVLGSKWRQVLRLAADRAWAYRAGGVYERSRGRWTKSAAAFISAGFNATDPISRHAFQVGAIDSLARAGKVDEAEALARRIAKGLRRRREPGLAARAMLNLGNSLVYQDRMSEARKVLQIVLPQLESSGLVQEATSARLALSSSHLFGGDPRLAESLAREVEATATESGGEYLANLARLNIALSMIVTGRSEEAHRILIGLRAELADSTPDSARVEEYLGDAYARLNLWEEAEESYRAALGTTPLIPLHKANLELGIGQALAAQGRPDEALAYFDRARRGYRKLNNRAWEAVCLHGTARIDHRNGRLRESARRLAQAEILASDSPSHLAEIWLTQSEMGFDRLQKAERLIKRFGYLDLVWKVYCLKAQRAKNPLPHFRKMFEAITAARLARNSVAVRFRFMEDKSEAIRAYLGSLLSTDTSEAVQEALLVIEQARSTTLIDEILTAGTYPKQLVDSLSRIRELIERLMDEPATGQARLSRRDGPSLSRAQKAATEGLMAVLVSPDQARSAPKSAVVLAETNIGIRILSGGRSSAPHSPDAKVAELLRWLPFELLAPMTDPSVDADPALAILQEIADVFASIWRELPSSICPDGLTWRIPWTACSHVVGHPREWFLSLHPAMNGRYAGSLNRDAKAVVWLGQSEDLTYAKTEAEAISRKFLDCPILTTRAEVQESINRTYEVVHVVSHAVHLAQNPAFSTIEFPDGPLFSYEIARSGLKVRLATLSACETGSVSIANRSEPDGIARAFLARGAESVVASQWPLDDEAGYRQFNLFFDSLIAKYPIEQALQGARVACRDWRAHPYYWGALALYAGYEK